MLCKPWTPYIWATLTTSWPDGPQCHGSRLPYLTWCLAMNPRKTFIIMSTSLQEVAHAILSNDPNQPIAFNPVSISVYLIHLNVLQDVQIESQFSYLLVYIWCGLTVMSRMSEPVLWSCLAPSQRVYLTPIPLNDGTRQKVFVAAEFLLCNQLLIVVHFLLSGEYLPGNA